MHSVEQCCVAGLESVVIGENVTSIRHNAFHNCTNLANVYCKGTDEDWANIEMGDYNSDLTSATVYYYSETEPTEEGNFWHYDENGEIAVWEIKTNKGKRFYSNE